MRIVRKLLPKMLKHVGSFVKAPLLSQGIAETLQPWYELRELLNNSAKPQVPGGD